MAAKLIGLYSPVPQSGKSTVAAYLSTRFDFQRRGFAIALKQMIHTLLREAGFSEGAIAHYAEPGKEETIPGIGKSYRRLAQTLGTEWGRDLIDGDLWVNVLMARAGAGPRIVIEDVRFPNEFDAILAAGGEVWRIERPDAAPATGHPSEGRLEGRRFSTRLTNSGSVEDLHRAVQGALGGF